MQVRALIQGRVQGVGFRPSVYRFARSLDLRGYVRNLGNGNVEILLDGPKSSVEEFLEDLDLALPPLAEILSMTVEPVKVPRCPKFEIARSETPPEPSSTSFIPQDVGTCEKCFAEIFDPDDRRYRYPFTTCTDCGPRYTISRGPPFDRVNTSMEPFSLCEECGREYADPGDRRYHAQTIACPTCGPAVWLKGPGGRKVRAKDPVGRAARIIDDGGIVAVRGIGGTHIACATTDEGPLRRLRKILKRPYQPFALMARGIREVRGFASVSSIETQALLDWRRPIVVLDKARPFPLPEILAPDLGNIGVMLPYTPLHHLLLGASKQPALVMTSANVHDEPMIIEEGRMAERLRRIEYVLWHNREITNRCDDSVLRFFGQSPVAIRRSRGYAPHPVEIGWKDELAILGVGPELSSTACIAKNGLAYLTQHIGNTSNFDTFNYLKDAINALMKNTNTLHLDAIAHDLHPGFLSTKLAESLADRWGVRAYPVQHHFAHLYALMAEHRIEPGAKSLAVICDGVGYGNEEEAWGGEILGVDGREQRLGSLEAQPLIGGDLAAIHPVRVAVGVLSKAYPEERLLRVIRRFCYDGLKHGEKELDLLIQQNRSGYNVHTTTSTGRILDAISALLGVSYERTYEGEGAMRLEGVASEGDPLSIELPVQVEKVAGKYVFLTTPLLEGVVDALEARVPREDIAAAAQEAVGRGLAEMTALCAEEHQPEHVGCSGGVMYNRHIVSVLRARIEDLLMHVQLPPGDGCICVGQAAAARRVMNS